jgi:hypothetical protein
MPIAGLRGTGSFGTDERPKNFRESILFTGPKGSAPIFALSSKASSKMVNDPEYAWWCESMTNVRLQANGAIAAGITTLVVDSVDPTVTTFDANYGDATNLKAGDLLLVEKTETATYDNEIVEVVSVLSATTIVIKRGAAGTTAATISDDAFLTLIGSSYAEGTAAPSPVSRNPLKFYNYTQIFKDSYELTGTADKTNFRTGNPWSNDKKRKTFDHARAIEWAMMFGVRAETTGDNGKPKRFMGGIRSFIPSSRTTIYGAATTVTSLLDNIYKVFDFDTPAGDERIGFCGNGALNELQKIIAADSNSDININQHPVKVFGYDFREFVMPQGRLLLRTHPLLSQHARFTKSMFILDFSSIKYVTISGRDTKINDDVQNKDEDLRRGYIQTECGLMVDYAGITNAYLGNISAT